MPTYSYECVKCEHTFEVFHQMSATPKIKCKACSAKCKKLIGTGSGIIFRGNGFYETDFKEKKGKAPKEESKTAEKSSSEKTADASTSSGTESTESSESSGSSTKAKGGDGK